MVSVFSLQGQSFPWLKSIGGANADIARGVCVDTNGGICIVGTFQNSININGQNYNSNGGADIFLTKMDFEGNFLWVKTFGSFNLDYAFDVDCDSGGNSIITGAFRNNMTLPGGVTITAVAGADVFTAKFDANGDCIWARTGAGPAFDMGNEINSTATNDILIIGNTEGDITFGTTTLNHIDSTDIYVAKYSSTGVLQMATLFGGVGYSQGRGISSSSNGNILISGVFTGSITLGNSVFSSSSINDEDCFVAGLDANGNVLWAKQYGSSTGNDYARGIDADAQGNVYVSGVFSGTVDFGGVTFTAAGAADIFLLKLDANGNIVWRKQIGGNGTEEGCEIEVSAEGSVSITGAYSQSLNLGGINFSALGARDIFIAKTDSSGNYMWAKTMGGNQDDVNYAIGINSLNQDLVTVGTYSNSFTNGTDTITSNGNTDSYISKMDSTLNIPMASEPINASLIWDGLVRTYTYFVSNLYDGSTKVPLVLSLHPGFSNAANHMNAAKWQLYGDTANFISVYPNGTTNIPGSNSYSWNAYNLSTGSTADDVGFLNALIDTMIANYEIDTCRIYISGFSNGAWMTWRMGCDFTNRFAAIGPLSGSWKYGTDGFCDHGGCNGSPIPGTSPPSEEAHLNCTPTRNIPYMFYRGTNEVSLTDRAITDPNGNYFWSNFNSCYNQPQIDTIYDLGDAIIREHYINCDSAETYIMNVIGNSHTWHASATNQFWKFFRTQSKCSGVYPNCAVNPEIASLPDNNIVCVGDVQTYFCTTPIEGSVYVWTITGGIILSGQGTSQITVQWNTGNTGVIHLEQIQP